METPTKKRKINKTDKARQYFEFSRLEQQKDQQKRFYICKICRDEKRKKEEINGTKSSNLACHLQKVHGHIYDDMCNDDELIEWKRQKLLLNAVEMVSVNGRAFNALNDSAILAMNEDLFRELQLAGRAVNLKDPNLLEVKHLLHIVAEKIKEKIGMESKQCPLCLMLDIGTSGRRSILGIRIQFILNGELVIRSVGMVELKESHTGEYLSEMIVKQLREFDIECQQVVTITTDNGANVLKTVKDFSMLMQKVDDGAQTIPKTPSKSKTNENRNSNKTSDDDLIDREIEMALALPDEVTEDDAFAILFDENMPASDEDLQRNELMLNAITEKLNAEYGIDTVWNIASIPCNAHTLQLAVKDAIKQATVRAQNVLKLSQKIAKLLRVPSIRRDIEEAGILYKLPRLAVDTRWCTDYLMMYDVAHCKSAIEYLASKKDNKLCALLLQKWHILKELINVLQVPYKATISLQRRSLTLSDVYGIWQKMNILLNTVEIQRICRTNIRQCLIDALNNRKKKICDNALMWSALLLDPRYRHRILRDEEKTEEAIKLLKNLWKKIEILRVDKQAIDHSSSDNPTIANCSKESVESTVSIDFDDPNLLDDFLSGAKPDETNSQSIFDDVDIENEIRMFDPNRMSSNESVLEYWNSVKSEHKQLYELARCIYAIPPTEVEIERDFSQLNFVLTQRRHNLTENNLTDILRIHLNKDLFFIVKEEELLKLKPCNSIET